MIAAVTPTGSDLLFTGDLNGNLLELDARSGRPLYHYDTKCDRRRNYLLSCGRWPLARIGLPNPGHRVE